MNYKTFVTSIKLVRASCQIQFPSWNDFDFHFFAFLRYPFIIIKQQNGLESVFRQMTLPTTCEEHINHLLFFRHLLAEQRITDLFWCGLYQLRPSAEKQQLSDIQLKGNKKWMKVCPKCVFFGISLILNQGPSINHVSQCHSVAVS